MDVFDEILPSQAASNTAQSGDVFDEILPSGPTPEGLKLTNVGTELARPFINTGKAMFEGAKQAFAPSYGEPNAFDRGLAAVTRTGPSGAEASQKYISTPVSQVTGLLQALFGGVPSAVGEEAAIANQRLRSMAGMEQNPKGDQILRAIGAIMTPASMASLPAKAATGLAKWTVGGYQKSITAAEDLGKQNSMQNVQNARTYEDELAANTAQTTKAEADRAAAIAQAEARRAEAHNQLARSSAELDAATANVAQRQGIQVTSPFSATLAAPVTNEQAYSFLKALKPGAVPSIPLKNLQSTAEDIVSQFEGIPKPLIPNKGVKTASELSPGPLDPAVAAAAKNLPDELSEAQKVAFAPLLDVIKKHNEVGGLSLDKLQQFKQSLGELTQVTGSSTLGRRLYRGLMDDLRDAAKTNPGAAQALKANSIASQNLAAADIADAVTYNGTLVDKFGRLRIQPNTLRKKLDAEELLQQLPEAKRKEVTDTLEGIYRANQGVEKAQASVDTAEAGVKAANRLKVPKLKPPQQPTDLPEIITPKTLKTGIIAKTIGRGIGAAIGGAAGAATGIPHLGFAGAIGGAHAGAEGADKLNQMIFQAALRPGGTAFLKTLFADMPPMAGDLGKAAALSNFLMQGPQ